MRIRFTGLVALCTSVLALGVVACVDESAPGGSGPVLPEECGASPLDCTLLQHQGETHVPIVGYNTEGSLAVFWSNKQGQPIPNGTVTWTLKPRANRDTHGARLMAGSSKTDGQGIATIDVRAGTGDTDFDVVVSAEGAQDIQFSVSVSQKGEGDLLVKVRYENGVYGPQARAFDETQVLLFGQGSGSGKLTACDEGFDPYDYMNTLPLPAIQSLTLGALPSEKKIEGLATGAAYTVVAFGRRVTAEGGIGLAWACWQADRNNGDHLIRPGRPVQADMVLQDLVPKYAGTYTVTSEFDFLAMAPDNVEVWVRSIGNLFVNPGNQILTWLEGVEAVASFLDTIGPFRATVEALLTDAIEGLLDFAPEIVSDIRDGTVDVFNIVTSLDVISEVTFDSEPSPATDASRAGVLEFPRCSLGIADAEGLPDGKCTQKEQWMMVGFDWRNSPICEGSNDERCSGYRSYGFADYGLDVVNSEFNAYTTNFNQLSIEPHPVNLDWGLLVLFVVEQLALPMIFDRNVDSLEDLLFILVGGRDCIAAGNDAAETCCTAFADRDTIANLGATVQSAARSLCKQGLPVVVQQLREQLIGQTVGSDEAFLLGTSDTFGDTDLPDDVVAAPCEMYDDEPMNLTYDKLGKKAGPRCTWIGQVQSGQVDPIEASFYGVRD